MLGYLFDPGWSVACVCLCACVCVHFKQSFVGNVLAEMTYSSDILSHYLITQKLFLWQYPLKGFQNTDTTFL